MQDTREEAWLALARAVAARLPVPACAVAIDAPGSRWRSLDVTYQPPHVERLYTLLTGADLDAAGAALLASIGGSVRLSLHLIHHCEDGAALFHPHPWPSAMGILAGGYRMRVGRGANDAEPAADATRWLEHAPGDFYAMCDRDDWHAVVPAAATAPALTMMLSGVPWAVPRPMPRAPTSAQPTLAPERALELAALFCALPGARPV